MALRVPHCEYCIILRCMLRGKTSQNATLNKIATIFADEISISQSKEIVYTFNLFDFGPEGLIVNKLALVRVTAWYHYVKMMA